MVGLVRTAQRVPNVEVSTEVTNIVRVMKIVIASTRSERHHFERVPRESIATMSLDGLEYV